MGTMSYKLDMQRYEREAISGGYKMVTLHVAYDDGRGGSSRLDFVQNPRASLDAKDFLHKRCSFFRDFASSAGNWLMVT